MAQTCSQCGKRLPDRSKFCPSCGEPRSTAVPVVGSDVRVADGGQAAIELTRSQVSSTTSRPRPTVVSGDLNAVDANFGQRMSAFLTDVLVMSILLMFVTFLLSAISNRSIFSSNAMLASFYASTIGILTLNYIILAGSMGQSLGKLLVGIRIVREDRSRVGLTTVLMRHFVGYFLSLFAFGLGFLWVLWDSQNQGWHDKIAKTRVVVA